MKIKNEKLIIILVLALLSQTLMGQKRNHNLIITPRVEEPRMTDVDEGRFTDSLTKVMRLIFEKQFDDSVIITLDKHIVFDSIVKTLPMAGVNDKFIDIDYSSYKKLPRLSIVLKGENKAKDRSCVAFFPVFGKRIYYIDYYKGHWSVECSNIQRTYR